MFQARSIDPCPSFVQNRAIHGAGQKYPALCLTLISSTGVGSNVKYVTPTHTQELEMLELNNGQKDLIGKGICGPSLALDDFTLQVLFSIVCQQCFRDMSSLLFTYTLPVLGTLV